jgi:pseudouridine-5'-phosphate glycosidase
MARRKPIPHPARPEPATPACTPAFVVAANVAAALAAGRPVVANPIPAEQELPAEIHDAALATALADAAAAGIFGREVTPFLLERIRVLTGDASLRANEALLVHNARVAAEIAVALAARGSRGGG